MAVGGGRTSGQCLLHTTNNLTVWACDLRMFKFGSNACVFLRSILPTLQSQLYRPLAQVCLQMAFLLSFFLSAFFFDPNNWIISRSNSYTHELSPIFMVFNYHQWIELNCFIMVAQLTLDCCRSGTFFWFQWNCHVILRCFCLFDAYPCVHTKQEPSKWRCAMSPMQKTSQVPAVWSISSNNSMKCRNTFVCPINWRMAHCTVWSMLVVPLSRSLDMETYLAPFYRLHYYSTI